MKKYTSLGMTKYMSALERFTELRHSLVKHVKVKFVKKTANMAGGTLRCRLISRVPGSLLKMLCLLFLTAVGP